MLYAGEVNASFPAFLLFLCALSLSCSPTTVAEGCVEDSDCQSAERCDEGACRSVAQNPSDAGIAVDRQEPDVLPPPSDAGVESFDVAPADAVIECQDNDNDGYGEGCDLGPDCDNNNNTLHTERILFIDDDNDTYSVGEGSLACTGDAAPLGFVFDRSASEDCNDQDESQFIELQGFPDSDNDGVTTAVAETLCTDNTLPAGYQLVASDPVDCNDEDNTFSPLVAEICDGLDNNCDGQADTSDVCPCPLVFLESGVGLVEESAPLGAEDRLHPYLSCRIGRRFLEARNACTSLANYDLVVIENEAEFNGLRQYTGLLRWWTGMNDISVGGAHRFLVPGGGFDGLVPEYAPWLPGEPNDASGEDCAEMRSVAESAPGGLNDLGCNENRFFLCESFSPAD